jgi:glutathione reductase (NADPH)
MVSHIYAVGDVTNRMALTPVAIREGHAFADTVYGGKRWTVDYANVPTAIFSTPELGTVGLTEKQAADRGWDLDIYTAEFTPLKNRLSGEHDKMFMKLVVSDHDQKVLGCHLAGHEAGELIQLAAIPVRMGATKADFDSVIAVHPTSAEELVTMKEPRKVKARASRAA